MPEVTESLARTEVDANDGPSSYSVSLPDTVTGDTVVILRGIDYADVTDPFPPISGSDVDFTEHGPLDVFDSGEDVWVVSASGTATTDAPSFTVETGDRWAGCAVVVFSLPGAWTLVGAETTGNVSDDSDGDAPSVDGAEAGDFLFCAWQAEWDQETQWSTPGSMQGAVHDTASGAGAISGAYEELTSGGATGTRTATQPTAKYAAASVVMRPPADPLDPDEPIWVGDAETPGWSEFFDNSGGIDVLPPQTRDYVSSPTRAGSGAYEHAVNGVASENDTQRSESSPNFDSTAGADAGDGWIYEGADLWFAMSVYLPAGFPTAPDDFQLIAQWKNDGTGSPPLSMDAGSYQSGDWMLTGGFGHPDGDRSMPSQDLGPITTGVWVDWLLHVVFSADPEVGSVEVYRDGTLVLPEYFPPGGTMYPLSPEPLSYWKIGLYRGSDLPTGPETRVYHDELRVGLTRDAVELDAPPPAVIDADGTARVQLGASGAASKQATTTSATSVTVTAAGEARKTATVTGRARVQLAADGATDRTATAAGSARVEPGATGTTDRLATATGSSTVLPAARGATDRTATVSGAAAVTVDATGAADRTATTSGTSAVAVDASGAAERTAIAAGASAVEIGAQGATARDATTTGTSAVEVSATGTTDALPPEVIGGRASVTLTASGITRKVATVTGRASVGLGAAGASAKASATQGTAAVGVGSGGQQHRLTPTTGRSTVQVTAAGTAGRTAEQTGRARVTVTALGTIEGSAVVTGTARVSLGARGTAARTGDTSGRARVQLDGRGQAHRTGRTLGRASVTLRATGAALGTGVEETSGRARVQLRARGAARRTAVTTGTARVGVRARQTPLRPGRVSVTSRPPGITVRTGASGVAIRTANA